MTPTSDLLEPGVELEIVPIDPSIYVLWVEWEVLEYDPRAFKHVRIVYSDDRDKRPGGPTPFRAPRWMRSLFPADTAEEALAILDLPTWQKLFAACKEDAEMRGALAAMLLLRGVDAFAAYARGVLAP